MNGYRNASYVGFVLFLIGLVLSAYGVYNLTLQRDLDSKGSKAVGKVVELAVTEPYEQAVVEFKTEKGQTVKFLDKLFSNRSFKKYQVGQEVEVLYDPAAPVKTAMINDFFQRNTEAWWPVILGGILFLVGFLMRKIMLKKARALDERIKAAR